MIEKPSRRNARGRTLRFLFGSLSLVMAIMSIGCATAPASRYWSSIHAPRSFPSTFIPFASARDDAEETVESTDANDLKLPRGKAILRIGSLDIDGDLGVNAKNIVRNDSSTSALGLDEETVFQPRIDLDWDWWHLSINALYAEYEGNGVTDTTIDFGNGNGITIGTPVRTEIELGMFTANLYVDVLPSDMLDLGVGIGVGVLDFDAEFRSLVSPATVTADNTLGFGYLSLRASKEFGPLELIGIASGASAEFDDEDLSYTEVDVTAAYRLFDTRAIGGSILGGYRWIDVDYEFSSQGGELNLEVKFEGPYLGFALTF